MWIKYFLLISFFLLKVDCLRANDDSLLHYAQAAVAKADYLLNSGQLIDTSPPEGLQSAFALINEARKCYRQGRQEDMKQFCNQAWLEAHQFVSQWKQDKQTDVALRANQGQNFVAVKAGQLALNVAGKRITLNEGEGLASGQDGLKKIILLSPPVIASTTGSSVKVFNQEELEIEVKAVTGARGYLVDVAKDPLFKRKILKAKEFQGLSFKLEGQFQQVFYVRFASVDNNGLPGKSGDPLKVSFLEDRRSPKVRLEDQNWQ